MFGWPQVALVVSLLGAPAQPPSTLAHPELQSVQALGGSWTCRLGQGEVTLRIAERHARPDQPGSPVESFTVDLGGKPVERYGIKSGLITFDPKDQQLHFDADGKCTLPGPIDDDDDPDTGTQRCFRVTGRADARPVGAVSRPRLTAQRWMLKLARPEEKARALKLDLRQTAEKTMTLTLTSGKHTVARGTCQRGGAGTQGLSAAGTQD